MIVRECGELYVIIGQYEHGLVSGEFARYWAGNISPLAPTVYAISEHDLGWQELDGEVRWNPETGRPYSFMDYPLEPKLQAYKHGLDLVEAQEPYAGYLCSMHYSSFVRDSGEKVAVEFRDAEERRRKKIEAALSEEALENAEYNFRLLQLCDDLSLFLCLNEPGENTFPWYRDGLKFMGEVFATVWRSRHTLSFEPYPFSGSFDLVLPYRLVDHGGHVLKEDGLEVRVTP